MMNWKSFEFKNDGRESRAFEQLSYLLFCAELGNRVGLFRYKNQAGIETEPVEKDGVCAGFQAKYYTTPLSKNKQDMLDAIRKAKEKNPGLNTLYLYVNQEMAESSRRGKKKAGFQEDIEKAAADAGLALVWRVRSHLELQLSKPENAYIRDLFFSPTPNLTDVPDEIKCHNDLILKDIQTEIRFGDNVIRIDRTAVAAQIAKALENGQNLVISGEGGCGKTAVFKLVYAACSGQFPICVFKAGELGGPEAFSDMRQAFREEPRKVFVIDSAEKIAEHADPGVHEQLIRQLKAEGWTLVFTTRYVYLGDLTFHLKEDFQIPFRVVDIPLLQADELERVCLDHGLRLPDNQKFAERLRNLFYLNEYAKYYTTVNRRGDSREFIDTLWKKRIKGSVRKDNLDTERERCLLEIAKTRYDTGSFFVPAAGLPQQALFALQQDEIVGYDEPRDACFITHDIYEEWALRKSVGRCFVNSTSPGAFFAGLGQSLMMRRAFRMWLSEQIAHEDGNVNRFILQAFESAELSLYWKDEILVSVLLSDAAESFVSRVEDTLARQDFLLLRRSLFLLRIACTSLTSFKDIETNVPQGAGWSALIERLHTRWESFFQQNLPLAIPVLEAWTNSHPEGDTTRHAGLLALGVLQNARSIHLHRDDQEPLIQIVFQASASIKEELRPVLGNPAANRGLCELIDTKPYRAARLIRALPTEVMALCNSLWQKPPKKASRPYFERDSMESRFGLSSHCEFHSFPPSANKTPVGLLLGCAPREALGFIIDFINKAVEKYSQSDDGKKDVRLVPVHVNGKTVQQYFSNALWCMYRGTGSPVMPYMLQSIHMVLEKRLLDLAKTAPGDMLEKLLLSILERARSASISAVVCSVVLAHPDKLQQVALVLFRTIAFFHADSYRARYEGHAKQLYQIGYGMDELSDRLYTDERMATCEEKHRNNYLEGLFLQYQFGGVHVEELYGILDAYRDDGSIELSFTPKAMDQKLKEQSEQAQAESENYFKYAKLGIWGDFLTGDDKTYDANPLLALEKTKQLVEELRNGRHLQNMDETTPPKVCAKLMIQYRDLLTAEDRLFCKNIIDEAIGFLFSRNYWYQISDGVEAAIRAVPALMETFPEADYVGVMVLAMLDETPIGEYKRICDYVTDAVQAAKLWETAPAKARTILAGYLAAKPRYDKACRELEAEHPFQRIMPYDVRANMGAFQFPADEIDANAVAALDVEAMEKVLLLIPSDTEDAELLALIEKMLPVLAANCPPSPFRLFRRLAYFLLYRKAGDVARFLSPFSGQLGLTDKSALFISELVSAENRLERTDTFWAIWKHLFPRIATLSEKADEYTSSSLIINYLLAWPYWKSGIRQWHALTKERVSFYGDVSCKMAKAPETLYSIARVLNTIGYDFKEEGVMWLSEITQARPNLKLGSLEASTVYYMERFMRRFVFENRPRIKTDLALRTRILTILSFMIERGSAHAYRLQESIL